MDNPNNTKIKKDLLMAVDAGNTNTEIGVFYLDEEKNYVPVDTFRLSTELRSTTDEIGVVIKSTFKMNGIKSKRIKAAIISSVVPHLNHAFIRMCRRYFDTNPLFISVDMPLGMEYRYSDPTEIGSDRIVNAAAVDAFYKGPAIIVDFGTATTICAISENHEYLGGVILPGIRISSEALVQKAAMLPKFELTPTQKVINITTVSNMQSGVYWGHISAIEGIVERMRTEMKAPGCKVIATGGFANFIATGTSIFNTVDNILTLKGLKLLYHRVAMQSPEIKNPL